MGWKVKEWKEKRRRIARCKEEEAESDKLEGTRLE